MQPKYSLPEIERRWRVELSAVGPLEGLPCRAIEDLYVQDARLRLRKETAPDGAQVFKLCKKYGKTSRVSEPITNLYLSEAEYGLLSALPGRRVVKRRYKLAGGSLDVYETSAGQVFFEKEFASEEEAHAYQPPLFVGPEVTGEPAQTGAAVAEKS